MVNVDDRRTLARTALALPRFGVGTAPIGNPGGDVSEVAAQETLQAAWQAGVRYFDTAPFYGHTLAEHRLGQFLRQQARHEFTISTKIGRCYRRPADAKAWAASPNAQRWKGRLPFEPTFDYTYAGVMRSFEDSLQRLGLPNVDVLVIHDIDTGHHFDDDGVERALDQLTHEGGFKAMCELKANGDVLSIGAGINRLGMIPRFVQRLELDFFLVAMPYTLLSQAVLAEEFPLVESEGASVIIGSVFASGILATGPVAGATYDYAAADNDIVQRVAAQQEVCERHGVELPAAALQFPLAHPCVAAIIPGAVSAAEVTQNISRLGASIPADFWAELKAEGLIDAKAPTPA